MERILVCTDYRIGNSKQALALAQNLGIGYIVKNVTYTLWAKLPNAIIRSTGIHINKKESGLLNFTSPPSLVISAGRRSAATALYIKNHIPSIKIVQIMNPQLPIEHFDLVIFPQHDDKIPNSTNVVTIVGALNNIKTCTTEDKKAFITAYPNFNNFLTVLIGGSSNHFTFTDSDGIALANMIDNLTKLHNIPVAISFSRRTPISIKKCFIAMFDSSKNIIYDPGTGQYNPYPAMLAFSKFVIITADSVSMCSEVAASRKPCYLFIPSSFDSKKHLSFANTLVQRGIAKILVANTKLQEYIYEPLDELGRVASIIKRKFF